MKSLQSLLLVAALVFAIAVKGAENARQIASATFPSVVLLVMEDERGQPVSLGSGFFVRESVIASNFHVVEKAARGYAKLVGQKAKFNISGIVAIDTKHDLVLLGVEDATAPVLKISDGSKVAVGDTVFAVGNPQGLEGTFSQGIVSGIRQFDADSLLQITAPISPGSSGGPVVDSEGKVIGVAVATFKSGQNLNFAIPAKYVEELLQETGNPEPLSSKKPKASRSILDEIGGGEITDGVVATSFRYELKSSGRFSFTILNQLREPVRDVRCLVVVYDTKGMHVDFALVRYEGVIPAGLGKRIEDGRISPSAAELNSPGYEKTPKGKVEFRVLGFEIDQQ